MLNGAYIGGYFGVINAVRPNNIGIGIWNKQRTAAINSFANDVKAFDKFGKIMAGITVAIQVGEGVFNDYNRGYSLDRIMSNAVVNTIVYGASAWGACQNWWSYWEFYSYSNCRFLNRDCSWLSFRTRY